MLWSHCSASWEDKYDDKFEKGINGDWNIPILSWAVRMSGYDQVGVVNHKITSVWGKIWIHRWVVYFDKNFKLSYGLLAGNGKKIFFLVQKIWNIIIMNHKNFKSYHLNWGILKVIWWMSVIIFFDTIDMIKT